MISEEIREVSANELARLTHRDVRWVKRELATIPAAYRTDGGHWRCPLWAWKEHTAERTSASALRTKKAAA